MSASVASAATFTINNVEGSWTDASATKGGVSGIDTNRIRWGTPVQGEMNRFGRKSGYVFRGLTSGPTGEDTAVNLGRFVHNNFAISSAGTSLIEASLRVVISGTWLDEGVSQAFSIVTNFVFQHTETRNQPARGASCPFGVPPCADIVTPVQNNGQTSRFDVNGKVFEFVSTGFLGFGEQFITQEGRRNAALFQGQFREIQDIEPPPPPAPVPLPASAVLLGAGVAALAAARARRPS